ncbi:MAG: hypothetical protein AAFU71_07780 [Cyanobacteria bacterium J06632_22]
MLCQPIRLSVCPLVAAVLKRQPPAARGQPRPRRTVKRLLVWGMGVLLGATPPLSTAAVAQSCTVLPRPQRLNTERRGDVIHIGALPWRPYSVILPTPPAHVLGDIRACVPDAYQSRSRLGPFVQVGSFTTRAEAEAIHRQFVAAGYSTRVTHRRGVSAF